MEVVNAQLKSFYDFLFISHDNWATIKSVENTPQLDNKTEPIGLIFTVDSKAKARVTFVEAEHTVYRYKDYVVYKDYVSHLSCTHGSVGLYPGQHATTLLRTEVERNCKFL